MAAESERMSDKSQNNKKNMSFSVNMKQLMNTMKDNKKQKSFSKMIQNFKNLFHQEFAEIERVNKMFVT